MATLVEYFPFFLDLEFFAHFHDKRVFGVDSFMGMSDGRGLI